VHDYRRLEVWGLARRFVKDVYEATSAFPPDERYGLTGQLRRAAVSIPSNLAEGAGRGTDRQFAHHVRIAVGSACEVDTQLLIAFDVGYLDPAKGRQLASKLERIKAKLAGLERALAAEDEDPNTNRA